MVGAIVNPFYRLYELPWTTVAEDDSRFRKFLAAALVLVIALAIIIPLIPVKNEHREAAQEVPPRLAQLMIETKQKPPPPPPKIEQPKSEPVKPVVKPVKPEPKPVVVDRTAEARAKAEKSGLLKFQDQLADLRENPLTAKAEQMRNLTGKVGETTHAERSLITSKVGSNSGGINTANLSRGYGAGGGALTGHDTTQVVTSFGGSPNGKDGVKRSSSSTRPARSREEIELVFDRNKGAIYSLYSRALRDQPALQGKLVLQLTITPAGDVSACSVVSSELHDAELERKLVARVKLFRFEAKDVETITTTKPIDFFPA
jgi:protein TonB